MFFGLYEARVKVKNRIILPARLRAQTGDKILITNWFENSLLVLPKKNWDEFFTDLFGDYSYLNSDLRDLDRFVYGGTTQVDLDKEGRFVLPGYLKEYAKIDKEIVFLGGAYYIQIFDKKIFQNVQELTRIQLKEKAKRIFNIKNKNTNE